MAAAYTRDAVATAAIFGVFACSWFGWAHENPPPGWRRLLIAGTIAALLIAVAGGVLTWQFWSSGTAINGQTGRTFGLIVGLEFALAGLGSGVLGALKRAELIPAWIALVVGVHFVPLAPLLQYPLLYVVAVLVCAVALLAVPVARAQSLAVSAVAGLATGSVLLAAALVSLIIA